MFLQPPPAQSMVQALELLYALGGTPVSYVFSDLLTNRWCWLGCIHVRAP